MTERYGLQQVKKSAAYFLVGKLISAVAGLVAVLLTVRALSIAEFADYSILIALIELATAISGIGITHAVVRYVPELFAKYYNHTWRQFLRWALFLRLGALFLLIVVAYFNANLLSSFSGVKGAVLTLQLFLLLVLFRVTAHFLSQILESCLLQGNAQLAFLVGSICRVLGLLVLLMLHEKITINQVIIIEAIADLIAVIVLFYGVYRVYLYQSSPEKVPNDDKDWFKNRFSDILKFSINGYLQHLANLPNGGNANRIVGGHLLTVSSMASFGFAQSFYEYMKRYFPAQLLIGMIRPIILARYVESGDFSKAASLCSRVFQINFLLISLLISVLITVGDPIVQVVSNQKYGSEAAYLLVGLLIVLVLETQRQQLDLLIQAVERNSILIVTNLILSSSVFVSVLLISKIGAYAFPIAGFIGLVLANLITEIFLKRAGFHVMHDWASLMRILLIFSLSAIAGYLVLAVGGNWILSLAIVVTLYCLLAFGLYSSYVRDFIVDLTGSQRSNIFLNFFEEQFDEPKIAFGILSCRKSDVFIDQIARKVSPHLVYVHHDYHQQPDFNPSEPNVRIVKDSFTTAWGDWSLVAATLKIMSEVAENNEITHFQLLSESCLPIKPISAFADYLKVNKPTFMIDYLAFDDAVALYSHGWRYLSTHKTLQKILKRASIWTWGPQPAKLFSSSVQLATCSGTLGVIDSAKRAFGKLILDIAYWLFLRKFSSFGVAKIGLGGQWFGVSRAGLTWILDVTNQNPKLLKYFKACHIPDEAYLQTLIANCVHSNEVAPICRPSNHAMFWHSCGTGPDVLQIADLNDLLASSKFFARKFALETSDVMRCSFDK